MAGRTLRPTASPLNESRRKIKHSDDIIDKMVDTEVEVFSRDTGWGSPAALTFTSAEGTPVGGGVVAAPAAAATPARRRASVLTLSSSLYTR